MDPTTQQVLDQAVQHHQAGRLHDAEVLYRRILGADPANAEALHLLGVLAQQIGRGADALELIQRAIAIDPQGSTYYGNLGIVLVGRALHRRFSVVCGTLGLIGLALVVLLLTGVLGGKDVWGGAAERLTIFPLLIAMIVTGGVALARPIRA